MAIETYTGQIVTSGGAGTSTGDATVGPVNGRVLAIYVDYNSDANTSDLTFATVNAPIQTILTLTNTNTDGWYYPRAGVHSTAGAAALYAAGGQPIVESMPVDDYIKASVVQDDNAKTINFWILVENGLENHL